MSFLRHTTLAITTLFLGFSASSCKDEPPPPAPKPNGIMLTVFHINDAPTSGKSNGIPLNSTFTLYFSNALDTTSAKEQIAVKEKGYDPIALNYKFFKGDSAVKLIPKANLKTGTGYVVAINAALKSKVGTTTGSYVGISVGSMMDTTDKFPRISDEALLDSIQYNTFQYFWKYGHPNSGLARERNTSGDLVTSGGSGMGIMAIIAGINRGFITRTEGLARIQKMTTFLKNTAQTFHGAYSHWLDGNTGRVIAFSSDDNGGDLVETSYLIQGLLTARAYFDQAESTETQLRSDITTIWERIEWDWYTKGNSGSLYWHWSPNLGWKMNMTIRGWNECLITYVLAASSPTHAIDLSTYQKGWAGNGSIKNGNSYYGFQLPLGESLGGPLFFSHYTFLGLDPRGLADAYANYETQTTNHSKINHAYCKANPRQHYGYSDQCWGLTASDNNSGYSAHSPNNDLGVISPTAALSSMPYTPTESMKAARYFYYKLGDKIWRNQGFTDAFNLNVGWFATSFLAIDQGPIVVMIENYRSQLLWKTFTSDTEVKAGLKKLQFTAPYL
jgi:hypothetical protein